MPWVLKNKSLVAMAMSCGLASCHQGGFLGSLGLQFCVCSLCILWWSIFKMPLRDDDGAVKPLTLRVAMVMFAFLLLSLMQCAWVGGVGVGVGMVGH